MNSPNPYEPPASLESLWAESVADETPAKNAELTLSSREEDASRALKSAVLGLFFCPLQLYTAWLLFLVAVNQEPLRKRYFWYAVGAWAIMVPDVVISATVFALLQSS